MITFIHKGGEQMASYRYRAKIPAEELSKRGIETSINSGPATVVVFSKPMGDDLELARNVKRHGAKVVVDVCDNHDYADILSLADQIICPTPEMARILHLKTGREIDVIPDPYETPLCTAHAMPGPAGANYLWFGHPSNYGDIEPYKDMPNLKIVCDGREGTTFWSPENMERAFREANIVLLPTRAGAEYKSPNRVINALRAGCFPICSPHPAYEEFKDFIWTGGLYTGLRWADEFRKDLNKLVRQGQEYVEKYSPEKIGEKWQTVLGFI